MGAVEVSKVREVRCTRLRVPLRFPFVTSLRRVTEVETLLVSLIDDDGLEGWGEAPQVWQVTGESVAGAEACVQGPLIALLVGADPDDLVSLCGSVRRAVVGNNGSKAAVDVALHDLVARRRGVSLARLLGGTSLRVGTDVTVAADDVEVMRDRSQGCARSGFTTLKLKVGLDPSKDCQRVLAVREAVGADVQLRLDANQGWSAREAVTIIRRLEDEGAAPQLVEQPVDARDVRAMAWVRDRVSTPIMADESVFDLRGLLAVIRSGADDAVNLKLAKCGGLREAHRIIATARAHGLLVMAGCMIETSLGITAAAHLAPLLDFADLDGAALLAEDPCVGATIAGGVIRLPDGPGLGVEDRR